MSDSTSPEKKESEFATTSGWKNPYVLYIVLMLGLFFLLVVAGYLALTQGWIPRR